MFSETNEQEKQTIKELFKKDLRKWAIRFENFIEENTVAHLLLKITVFVIGGLSVIFDATNILKTIGRQL